MSLHEQLSERTASAFRYCCENPDDPFNPNIRTFVDNVLAAVRDALLAPEVVEVFVAVTGFDYEGSVRNGLTAALDAAFGTEASDE